jgi:hypothetical protein
MSRVKGIKSEIQRKSRDELTAFRAWFEGYDAEQWNRDALAERTTRALADGQTADL